MATKDELWASYDRLRADVARLEIQCATIQAQISGKITESERLRRLIEEHSSGNASHAAASEAPEEEAEEVSGDEVEIIHHEAIPDYVLETARAVKQFGQPVSAADVARALGINKDTASARLSRARAFSLIRRAARGLYLPAR